MRKFLVVIVFAILTTISVTAQTLNFRTTSFTVKEYTSRGWTKWEPRQSSNLLLTMNFDRDVVTIYSARKQIYRIISYEGGGLDYDGDTVVEFYFIDQDGDRGAMRLMQRRNGLSEVYIAFSNVVWCYSVVRI